MIRSLQMLCRPTRAATLAAIVAIALTPAIVPADPPSKEGPSDDASATRPGEIPPVPDGNDPQTIEEYLEKISSIGPAEETPEALRKHVTALTNRVDAVLKRNLEPETLRGAAAFRFALYNAQMQLGENGAQQKRDEWLAALMGSKDAVKANTGRAITILRDLQQAVSRSVLQESQLDVWEPVINQTATLLKDTKADPFAADVAVQVTEQLEMYGDPKWSAPAIRLFAKLCDQGEHPMKGELVAMLEAKARTLELPGTEMVITGTTVDGKPFELTDLKGQVVLVDFWATWCGYCIEAFPRLEELYEEHHDDGFEIVGVNQDDTQQLFADYLKSAPLPWMQIQNLGGDDERPHPNAARYGVDAIPFMALIDAEGKVVKVNVTVDELEELLKAELKKRNDTPE